MSANIRWISIAFGLGLCTAYTLWGTPKAATSAASNEPPANYKQFDPKHTAVNPAKPPPPSVLKFNPPGVDFGEVPSYDKRTAVVALENPGGRPITVSTTVPGCGCLKIEMNQKTIAPGKSEKAEVSFIASPRDWKGELTATFNTDEPGQAVLKCKGSIRQEFSVEPLTLNFDRLGKRGACTRQAVIKQSKGVAFEIKSVFAKNAEFQFKWAPVEGSHGSAYTICATATGIKPGHFSEAAVIRVNNPNNPMVNAIPLGLTLQVVGDVSCSPGTVMSQQALENEAEVFETTVKRFVSGPSTTPLEVVKVTDSKNQPIEFSCQRIDENNQRLKIKPPREFAKQAKWGYFQIYTNVEEEPVQLHYLVKLGAEK